MPVETAQKRASAMTRSRRSRRSERWMWLSSRPKPRVFRLAAGFQDLVQLLDGLITNDKFCLSRLGRLTLSWWRYPLRRRDRDRPRAGTVPDPDGDRGGAHEAPVADSPPHAAGRGRGATVGPGVPADPGLGRGDRPADGAGTEHLLPGSQEVSHDGGGLCARVDPAPGAGADHRAAARAAARPPARTGRGAGERGRLPG